MAMQITTFPPVTIASGGVAVRISNLNLWVTSVTIEAAFTNVSKINVGDSTVTSSNGIEVTPGDTCAIEAPDGARNMAEMLLSDIWVVSATAGDSVRVAAFKRKP